MKVKMEIEIEFKPEDVSRILDRGKEIVRKFTQPGGSIVTDEGEFVDDPRSVDEIAEDLDIEGALMEIVKTAVDKTELVEVTSMSMAEFPEDTIH